MNFKDAAGALVVHPTNEKLFLAIWTQERGYALPFGKVESGESFEVAAIREVFEETGIRIEIPKPGAFFLDTVQDYYNYCFFGVTKNSDLITSKEGIPCWVEKDYFLFRQNTFVNYSRDAFIVYETYKRYWDWEKNQKQETI